MFVDSDEPGGPAYSWIDITPTGTNIAFSDENRFGPLPLGFTFNFYGIDYTDLWAGSNGWIKVGATDPAENDLSNDCPLPNTSGIENLIGGIWDDLDNDTSTPNGTGYYQSFAAGTCPYPGYAGACMVVEWYNMYHYASSPADNMTFEIVLFDDHSILIQFLDASNEAGSGSTTGIENADATIGLTYACNTAGSLHDALAVRFFLFEGPSFGDSTKEAVDLAVVGDPIDYTITILNTGEVPGLETAMVDPIPAGTVYNGDVACSSGQCWYDSGTVYWAGQVAGPPNRAGASYLPGKGGTAVLPGVVLSATGAPKAVPTAPNPEDVLWDQYANWSGGNFASQDFETTYDAYDVYAGDDFENTEPWTIDTIVSRGGFYEYVNLLNATALHWYLYADASGQPAGFPGDGSELWSLTLAPTDGQVGLGVYEAEDVVLTLDTPITLPAGHWWLVFFPSLEFGLYGQYGWSGTADAVWGSTAMQANPNGGFGMGSGWWTNTSGVDYMFRLEGTAGEQPPENPVTVTFSVTPDGLGCGDIVHNEATITDPGAIGPVVVAADTMLVAALPLLVEGFEDVNFPPLGWTETIVNDPGTDPDWSQVTAGTSPTISPHGGAYMAKFNSYSAPSLASARLAAYALDFSGMTRPVVGFYMSHDTGYSANADQVQIQVSTDGVGWTNVGAPILRYDAAYATPGWGYHEVDLAAYAGEPVAYVGLLGISSYGNNFYVDDVSIGQGCYVPSPEIDVTPAELSQTLCPDETAEQTLTICNLGDAPLTWDLTEVAAGKANAPTDIGFAQDIGYISDNFVSFPLNDFTGQTVVGTNAVPYYGIDFDPTATTLYALNDTTDQLGTIDLATGAFTGLVSCPPGGGAANWTGLAIDPVSGVFYGSTATQLFTIDPGTGLSTLVGTYGVSTMIAIAVNGDGLMYGHDITSDSIYQVDPATGATTLVGPTGYAANYAQGMDFDNQDGTLYIWLYIGSGSNVYGTVNLATGAVTPLAVSAPLGEFEGATQTTAGPPPDYIPWLSEDPLEGTVDPETCQDVTVTFDSTGLTPGDFYGSLLIDSNDPDEPEVVVPVQLTVEECVQTMHLAALVGNIALDPYGRFVGRWYVQTHDGSHNALGGVQVRAWIYDPIGGPYERSRITKPSGWARFHWGRALPGGFELCVIDLIKDGYTYERGDDHVPPCLEIP